MTLHLLGLAAAALLGLGYIVTAIVVRGLILTQGIRWMWALLPVAAVLVLLGFAVVHLTGVPGRAAFLAAGSGLALASPLMLTDDPKIRQHPDLVMFYRRSLDSKVGVDGARWIYLALGGVLAVAALFTGTV